MRGEFFWLLLNNYNLADLLYYFHFHFHFDLRQLKQFFMEPFLNPQLYWLILVLLYILHFSCHCLDTLAHLAPACLQLNHSPPESEDITSHLHCIHGLIMHLQRSGPKKREEGRRRVAIFVPLSRALRLLPWRQSCSLMKGRHGVVWCGACTNTLTH